MLKDGQKPEDVRRVEDAMNHESKERPQDVVMLACMDENNNYGDGAEMLVAGSAGSMVTHLEGGDTNFFPLEARERVARLRPVYLKALQIVADRMGKKLVATSHDFCGWLGKQGAGTKEQAVSLTNAQMTEVNVPYVGHIPYDANGPVEVGNSGLKAHIDRPEHIHAHPAKCVLITYGGFITNDEITDASGKYGDAFIVSADWMQVAINELGMSHKDAMFLLTLQLDVADGIADGVVAVETCQEFNGHRLDEETTNRNRIWVRHVMLDLAIAQANNERHTKQPHAH